MSVRHAFEIALAHLIQVHPAPVRLSGHLAVACHAVLPVAGVTLSLFNDTEMPFPIGVSDEDAAVAESLQFSTAEGPCREAWRTQQPVVADASTIRTRWPLFNHGLLANTPFRAVVSLPLRHNLETTGTLNLFLLHDNCVSNLNWSDLEVVNELISTALMISLRQPYPDGAQDGSELGPPWLRSVHTAPRNGVFTAIGMLCEGLGVSVADALALLRARAFVTEQTVDQIAADINKRRIMTIDLNPFPR